MHRSRLVPVIALSMSLLGPHSARAVPSATNSTAPTLIWLVGGAGVVPDSTAGKFEVVVRDLANNPVHNASVVIDLSGCTDLAICADQLDPSAITSCAAKLVHKVTDALGRVTFTVLGGSNGAGNAQVQSNGGRIFANGVLIRTPSVASFDLDSSGGVGAGDLSAWLTDFASGVPWGRSDYDGSGAISANDLAMWLTVFGAGASAQSCRISCP